MLIMVIEKPMQFTIVNDVPRDSSIALYATKVENNGESAITTRPQKNKKRRNTYSSLLNKNNGETIQQRQERNNERVASFLGWNTCESNPLKTHANPPEAIIRNEKRGTFKVLSEY